MDRQVYRNQFHSRIASSNHRSVASGHRELLENFARILHSLMLNLIIISETNIER